MWQAFYSCARFDLKVSKNAIFSHVEYIYLSSAIALMNNLMNFNLLLIFCVFWAPIITLYCGTCPICITAINYVFCDTLESCSFTNTYFIAAIKCSVPPSAPMNGNQNYSGATVGSTVTYSCDPGYTLQGDNRHTCIANRQWSGQANTNYIFMQIVQNLGQ